MSKRKHTTEFPTGDGHGVRVSYGVWPSGQGATLKFDDLHFGLNAADIGEMASLLEGMREAVMQAALEQNRRETRAQIEAQLKEGR